jgi:hypothetical protein
MLRYKNLNSMWTKTVITITRLSHLINFLRCFQLLEVNDSKWVEMESVPTSVRRPVVNFIHAIEKLDHQLQMLVRYLKCSLSNRFLVGRQYQKRTDSRVNS